MWICPKRRCIVLITGYRTRRLHTRIVSFDEKTLTLRVTVENTGNRDGAETVQIYFRDLVSSVITPVKRLIAFGKTQLQAGESTEIEFAFTCADFSFVNANEERVTKSSAFEIMSELKYIKKIK